MPLVGEGRTDEPQANQRLTVAQAATTLGITEGAVRSRIKRGTLRTTKEGGAVFVLLRAGTSAANQPPDTDIPGDQSELVEALREQVAYLRGVVATRDQELALRAEEIRRRDAALEREQQLTAIFADRLRELEAPARPSEARESPVSPGPSHTPTPAPGDPHAATEGAEARSSPAGGERSPWWRRIFGG